MLAWEEIFVCLLLLAALISFVWEKIPTDMTAILVFGVLMAASFLPFADTLPKMEQLLHVFANPAPLAIAALFIISAALEKCGLIDSLASLLGKLTRLGYHGLLVIMILMVAVISAFINNTPVVVIFIPVILSLSRKLNSPASKLLIPLSYASIFGGVCTLVGTSTNILASGIMRESGFQPLSMFELSKVGIPLMVIGTLYLTLFARRRLPIRETLTSILSDEERKEFFTEAFIRSKSNLIGQTFKASPLQKARGIRLLEIIRNGVAVEGDIKSAVLRASDRLVLACRPSGFVEARSVEGLKLAVEEREGLETISAHEGAIVEGVIGPRSSIIGKTIHELNFRQRFRMIILAIHRRGINMRERIDTLPLEAGDTILMMGTDSAREQIRRGSDILLLDQPHTSSKDLRKKAPIILAALVGVIASVSLNLLPITAAAIIGVAVILLTGVIRPKDAYDAIDWSILILIYGMLALGTAMQTTGMAGHVAVVLAKIQGANLPGNWNLVLLLVCLYLATSILTEVLSNNATVVLMAPIALNLGLTIGVDPRPFVIAVCIASSASFSTPIGYQTNTYVYSVGGYRFADFLKFGLPLNIMYLIGTVTLVPIMWSF
ncbi:MAG: SLC13 family permease [Puniceicoccaceae bacterium]